MQIIVNGSPVEVDSDTIDYEDVLHIAKQREGATVTYVGPRHGDSQRSGTLYKGKPAIAIEPGMIIACVMTSNA